MSESTQVHHTPMEVSVDDCWNRIGVRGDRSCPELKQHFRCLNCPTFAAAASTMLGRAIPAGALTNASNASNASNVWGHSEQTSLAMRGDAIASVLIFRVGAEWLAFPTDAITEVIASRAIHSLPHQSNRAVLGLTNIRGALKICVSLARMLTSEQGEEAFADLRNLRLLVVTHDSQTLAFPINEVYGIHRYAAEELQPAPTTVAQVGTTFTHAVIAWDDKKVGLLDCDLLFYSLNRSLT
jgi:chemotaxis-related protein WspD